MTIHDINDIKKQALGGSWEAAYNLILKIPSLCDEINLCHQELAECYRLSGADPDGNEDWRIAHRAVAAVKELREEYENECIDEGKWFFWKRPRIQ